MEDQLLGRVERKVRSGLFLGRPVRQSTKPLPFTVMNLEENSHVVHFFEMPACETSDKPRFGVVTQNGCIKVYDTMFRRITWKQQTNIEGVNWGHLVKTEDEASSSSTALIHSRKTGLHLVCQPSNENENEAASPPPESPHKPLNYKPHYGFCKPAVCSNNDVLLPVGPDKLGLLRTTSGEQSVTIVHSFYGPLCAIKEVASEKGGLFRMVLCTTGDAYVYMLRMTWIEGKGYKVEVAAQTRLPTYDCITEPPPEGLCIEGDDKTYVVGTNARSIFVVKWTESGTGPNSTITFRPCGEKILPTDGVACLAFREGKRVLAAGCNNGTVRLFNFPDMSQISIINFHRGAVTAISFVNENSDKTGRSYLLISSVRESFISVWNIPCTKDTEEPVLVRAALN